MEPMECADVIALTAAVESAATEQQNAACALQGGGLATRGSESATSGLATLARPDRASLRKQIEPTEKGPYISRLNVRPLLDILLLNIRYDAFRKCQQQFEGRLNPIGTHSHLYYSTGQRRGGRA